MDKDQGHQFKGKSLAEIDINPEADFADEEEFDDIELPQVNCESSNVLRDSIKFQEPSTLLDQPECKKVTGKYFIILC